MRSRSESAASVLSTQRACARVSGARGSNGPACEGGPPARAGAVVAGLAVGRDGVAATVVGVGEGAGVCAQDAAPAIDARPASVPSARVRNQFLSMVLS